MIEKGEESLAYRSMQAFILLLLSILSQEIYLCMDVEIFPGLDAAEVIEAYPYYFSSLVLNKIKILSSHFSFSSHS